MSSWAISTSSKLYPSNVFGHHNNVRFYHYQRYAMQGNNYHNYGLHVVEVKNNMRDKNIEVVGWFVKQGRLEEDFSKKVIRPGLFNTARVVPLSWTKYDAIVGAVVFKIEGTNQYFTLAFEDPFHDYVGNGYKGFVLEGNDPETAIKNLADHTTKEKPWGRYYFDEFNGRGRSVIEFRDPQ